MDFTDMKTLGPPCSTGSDGRRHYSMGNLSDRRGSAKEPLSVRLSATYRSARCPERKELPDRVVVIEEEEEEDDEKVEDNETKEKRFCDSSSVKRAIEINAGQPPPVDESLFFDNLRVLRESETNGTRLKSAMWSVLSVGEMKMLLEMERGGEGSLDGDAEAEESLPWISTLPDDRQDRLINIAYVWACFRGLANLLPKLEAAGADVEYVEPCTGINATLASALSGSVDCLRHLISRWKIDVNHVSGINNYTPLHFAAFGNSEEAAELLLDNGASTSPSSSAAEVEPVLHSAIRARSLGVVRLLLERGASVAAKNRHGETPLHVACFVQSIGCVEALLETQGTDVNAVDRGHRTPLHLAVMTNGNSSVEIVDSLLKHGAQVNASDKLGFTALHIAALNEQSRCVDSLIWAGADVSATTSTGLSALNVILRKIPESLKVFRRKLDASIRLKRPVPHNREFEMRFHFDLLFPSNNPCETSFINTFVQERRKDLLSHPLVMAFLHLKWEKIRKFYLLRIFFYAMTVVCMTTYVLTALAYKCYNNEDAASKLCNGKRLTGFLFRKTVIEIEWYLSLFLTCLTIPRKIFGFMVYKSARQYLSNIDNVLDGVVIASVFVTSFVYTGRTYDWQKYVGAFAILCAWANLMLMVGQLPAFGTYVAMFTHIQFEFAKLLLAYSGLLIGFTISFCVIFVGEPSFGNPFTGLIKVLAMMAGELDFEGLINQPEQLQVQHQEQQIRDGSSSSSFVLHHPLSVCSQILFTLFLVFVTVILMNLLVGIAVHDIQGLRNHAGLTKLVRQTKLILFSEMVLHASAIPYALRKWMFDHDMDVENRKRVLVVKPLNPLEKRLPKEILSAAYETARKNAPLTNDEDITLSEHVTWMKNSSHEDDIDSTFHSSSVDKLFISISANTEELRVIKNQLLDNNRVLTDVLSRLTKQRKI